MVKKEGSNESRFWMGKSGGKNLTLFVVKSDTLQNQKTGYDRGYR
jgi:hypothetical protein